MNKSTRLILIISIVIVFIGAGLIFFSTLSHKKNKNTDSNNNEFGIYKDEEELKKTLSQSFNLYGKCQT